MRYCQLVAGPAGSGKSTYCDVIFRHAEMLNRQVKVVNLDPAAENFKYPPYADISDLIQVADVMEDQELKLGPNGALIFCMEYLEQHLEWLEEAVGEGEDDYFLFDCPGQIELYTHVPVMRTIVDTLKSWNFNVCAVFVLDSTFLTDIPKFFSGTLVALSAMVNLEAPHVNVLTKMDLLNEGQKKFIEDFLESDECLLSESVLEYTSSNEKYGKLTKALVQVINDYSLVKYFPLDITDEETIGDLTLLIDSTIQYGEDLEVRDRFPEENDQDEIDRPRTNGMYDI